MVDLNNKEEQKIVDMPDFTIADMAKAGIHFGHNISVRNPKAQHFIYGETNNTHIIDLRKAHFALKRALYVLYKFARQDKKILFVSTAQKFYDQVKEIADACGQYYVRSWKGGMLTNWKTIVASIKELRKYRKILENIENKKEGENSTRYTKKEITMMHKRKEKLEESFGGVIDMNGMPDLVVVFSLANEELAVNETRCIGTPVIGIADTDSDPTNIEYPIPGNDDSLRAMKFYCSLFSAAIIKGTQEWMQQSGIKANEKKAERAENDAKNQRERSERSEKAKSKPKKEEAGNK
ncbi:30S ribosomal protein S2 [Rickettsiales bacterium]|nr:30S ribosomal protein S2 [Rickettsiales bacterium]